METQARHPEALNTRNQALHREGTEWTEGSVNTDLGKGRLERMGEMSKRPDAGTLWSKDKAAGMIRATSCALNRNRHPS